VRGHAPHFAGRDQVGVEHEYVTGIDPELHVAGPRPREPGMPAESHGTRAGVLADLELEVETRGAEPQRLPRRAAEGPPTPSPLRSFTTSAVTRGQGGGAARVSRMNVALAARYDRRSEGNRRARSFLRAA